MLRNSVVQAQYGSYTLELSATLLICTSPARDWIFEHSDVAWGPLPCRFMGSQWLLGEGECFPLVV